MRRDFRRIIQEGEIPLSKNIFKMFENLNKVIIDVIFNIAPKEYISITESNTSSLKIEYSDSKSFNARRRFNYSLYHNRGYPGEYDFYTNKLEQAFSTKRFSFEDGKKEFTDIINQEIEFFNTFGYKLLKLKNVDENFFELRLNSFINRKIKEEYKKFASTSIVLKEFYNLEVIKGPANGIKNIFIVMPNVLLLHSKMVNNIISFNHTYYIAKLSYNIERRNVSVEYLTIEIPIFIISLRSKIPYFFMCKSNLPSVNDVDINQNTFKKYINHISIEKFFEQNRKIENAFNFVGFDANNQYLFNYFHSYELTKEILHSRDFALFIIKNIYNVKSNNEYEIFSYLCGLKFNNRKIHDYLDMKSIQDVNDDILDKDFNNLFKSESQSIKSVGLKYKHLISPIDERYVEICKIYLNIPNISSQYSSISLAIARYVSNLFCEIRTIDNNEINNLSRNIQQAISNKVIIALDSNLFLLNINKKQNKFSNISDARVLDDRLPSLLANNISPSDIDSFDLAIKPSVIRNSDITSN